MKKILLLLFPVLCFSQAGGIKIDRTVTPYIWHVPGIVKYDYSHAVASVINASYTPTITQNLYTKLTPGMTSAESDHITFAGDTLTILTGYGGDYLIFINVSFSGANQNDLWRIKLYKNAVAFSPELGEFRIRTTTAGQSDTRSFFWYVKDLVAGDDLSFHMTNLTASRNPTFGDMKIFIEQKPE